MIYAFFIYLFLQLVEQKKNIDKYSEDALPLLLTSESLWSGVTYVSAVYLFCPYTIASCVAQTTTVFDNLVLAAVLASMIRGECLFGGTPLRWVTIIILPTVTYTVVMGQ